MGPSENPSERQPLTPDQFVVGMHVETNDQTWRGQILEKSKISFKIGWNKYAGLDVDPTRYTPEYEYKDAPELFEIE